MATAIRQSTRLVQGGITLLFPLRCSLCDAPVDESHALCGDCFADMEFQGGLTCDLCGVPLPGDGAGDETCDDCLALARPWSKGVSVIGYSGAGRRLVLKMKHGDRPDLARLGSAWMLRRGGAVLEGRTLVPVPAHWSRRVARRYNQAAELSRWLARRTGLDHLPLALRRSRATPGQDHRTLEQRFANLEGSIHPMPGALTGRKVCLIDDVMTSGATLSASARAALDGGATDVTVLVLARVAKRP